MASRTALYDMHVAQGARMVDFGGWDMPLNYGSQIEEHHHVRKDAGMFDVSHMTIIDLSGGRARAFLRYLLANDVARLKDTGKALYSCMLNDLAGVIDDLIVYYMNDNFYRMVVNASTREKDLAWITEQAAPYDVQIQLREDLAMIAVQGPNARDRAHKAMVEEVATAASELKTFFMCMVGDIAVARTGYTGEDGYEIMLPTSQASNLWASLAEQGVKPCGLGARDTLRLEAGMSLYGSDMDESVTPLESGLSWTIAWEPENRDFIGRTALQAQRNQGVQFKLVGLLLEDKGVLRNHQKVIIDGLESGEITSGSFSPTVGKSIALARVSASIGSSCRVDVRGRQLSAKVLKPPFARNGKACV